MDVKKEQDEIELPQWEQIQGALIEHPLCAGLWGFCGSELFATSHPAFGPISTVAQGGHTEPTASLRRFDEADTQETFHVCVKGKEEEEVF